MKKIVESLACVAMAAFCFTANAQNVSGNMSEKEMAEAIMADTTKSFIQTQELVYTIAKEQCVVAGENVAVGDTIYTVGSKYYYRNGKLRVSPAIIIGRAKTTVEVRDEEQWEKLKHASVETRFAEEMAASSGRKRDTQWYEVTDGKDTLKIVRHGVDKNHWYLSAQGDYQFSKNANGFGATAEVQYWSDSFWWAAVGASITRNETYALAEVPEEMYTSYAGHAIAGLKFDLGRRENFTIAPYGGFEYTWQKTNSREFVDEFDNRYLMKSTHSTGAPVVGLMLKYRFADTRVTLFARGEWSLKNYTYQNRDEYQSESAAKVSIGAAIGLHGNKVKTK